MRFKLDENLGMRTQEIFIQMGHDVRTVRDENMSGCSDQLLYETCLSENRCVVTFDLDFADVTRFSANESEGVVVIRVPQNPSLELLGRLIRQFLLAIETEPISGNLWIVEVGRIRVHQKE